MPLLDPSQIDPTTAVPPWLTTAQAPVGMLSATAGASPPPEMVGNGAPTSGTPPAVPGSSFLGRLQQYLGANQNMLLRMGAGMAGAPAFGVGVSRGLSGAATGTQEDIARQMMLSGVGAQYAALIKAGAAPSEALAAVYNPAIMAQVQKKYLPSGATTYAGGQAYDAAGRPIGTPPGETMELTDQSGNKYSAIRRGASDPGCAAWTAIDRDARRPGADAGQSPTHALQLIQRAHACAWQPIRHARRPGPRGAAAASASNGADGAMARDTMKWPTYGTNFQIRRRIAAPPSIGPAPNTNPNAQSAPIGPAPTGAMIPEWRQQMTAEAAKESGDVMAKAGGARDLLRQFDHYENLIKQAPDEAFGRWVGSPMWQNWVLSPVNTLTGGKGDFSLERRHRSDSR